MKMLVDAETFHVDPNRIVIAGFSAGGHLAALYGATCTERDSLSCPHCPRSLVLQQTFRSSRWAPRYSVHQWERRFSNGLTKMTAMLVLLPHGADKQQ
mmetsp:Transcript_46986/g.56533  ORF Transcript_46986/g.56533 Transcript_46986/m.56533 type:complete len:98 (-) Transcript_46986:79-372(-)